MTLTHRIALLAGGRSSEREVSLASGTIVAQALRRAGYEVTELDSADPAFVTALQELAPDIVFIALHGRSGEDGSIQGLLEQLRLPYTGSGVLASALAMDKRRSKLLYQAIGLNVPASLVLESDEPTPALRARDELIVPITGLPVVVKPVDGGSSVGISIVHEASELTPALEKAFAQSQTVLVEQFVSGTEITVSVLGNAEIAALPVVEVVPNAEFYDYAAKYDENGSVHFCPARIDAEVAALCQNQALAAHRAFGCRGVSRTDFIIDNTGLPWVIETNTIPGMTATSLLPQAAAEAGINLEELYTRLVELGLEAYSAQL
jgi:D-alanine-D-alanine ligase